MRKWSLAVLLVSYLGAQKLPKWDTLIVIETPKGVMRLQLYRQTPIHRANFIKLAKEGFFNGTTFHRVVPNFVIQGGDPNSKDDDPLNDGLGGPGYTLPAEFVPELKHTYSAVGAARQGDAINPKRESNGSQFYIVVNKAGTPFLDGAYTVFGKVLEGMEVAEAIAGVPRDRSDRPQEPIRMQVRLERHRVRHLVKQYGDAYKP
jgi:cyclophilin family peptidyl-prolyl cis-trans isomerase